MKTYKLISVIVAIASIITFYYSSQYSSYIFQLIKGKINVYQISKVLNTLFPPISPIIIDPNSPGYEWTNILQTNYTIILKEFETFVKQHPKYIDMARHEIMYTINKGFIKNGVWSSVTLRCYDIDTNISQVYFQETMNLIRQCDKMAHLPLIRFSILRPGTIIPQHIGHYTGILRYLLTLSVPEHDAEDLYLKVWSRNHDSFKQIGFQNGSHVLFDDMAIHSVWNNISGSRIVLYIDVERIDLSFWRSMLNNFFIGLVKWVLPWCQDIDQKQNELMSICSQP